MPKYHKSLTPVTLFLLRTCLYFQMLNQHSFLSHKCLKLNMYKTEFNLLFSNQILPSVLSQPREFSFLYSSKMETFEYPLDLDHSLTDLNLITQHNFLHFSLEISLKSGFSCCPHCHGLISSLLDHSFKLLQQSSVTSSLIPST